MAEMDQNTIFKLEKKLCIDDLNRITGIEVNDGNYRELFVLHDQVARFLSDYGINNNVFKETRVHLEQCKTRGELYEALQKSLAELQKIYEHEIKSEILKTDQEVQGSYKDWPLFHNNHRQSGYTDDPGPSCGKVEWKYPTGHSWYSRPAVDGGKVYVASPGITTVLFCMDLNSGEVLWELGQKSNETILSDNYGSPRMSSSVFINSGSIITRESGSWEFGEKSKEGKARRIWIFDKMSGSVKKIIETCNLDYRIGYAPLAANEHYIVCPWGDYHSISKSFAGNDKISQVPEPLDKVVFYDAGSGVAIHSSIIGEFYSEPVIDGDLVFVGNYNGTVCCIDLKQKKEIWAYGSGSAVNASPVTDERYIYFGNENGDYYCFDKSNGCKKWVSHITDYYSPAFQLFSRAAVSDGRLYIGSAKKVLYCLDKDSGKVMWEFHSDDWIRSQPVVCEKTVYFATMNGTLFAITDKGNYAELLYVKQITDFPVFSDIVQADGKLLITTSKLYVHCLDAESGRELWRHSLIKRLYIDGEWVDADKVGGGSDFQSSPIIADEKVFIGCPNRFVYALDHKSGRQLWKFETRGQVSAAPVYDKGKVFFGQQGGSLDYYCVNSDTGFLNWKKTLSWVWHASSVYDGKVLVPGCNGVAYALNAENGDILWQYETGGGCYPTPTVDGKNAFFSSWDKHYYALDLDNGSCIWKTSVGGTPDSGSSCLYEGKLYADALLNRYFYCMDAKTGKIIWKNELDIGYDCNSTPAIYKGRMVISLFFQYDCCLWRIIPNRTLCLDADTGKTIWEIPAGGGLTSAAISSDKVFFASTNDPYFYCADLEGNADGTSNILWKCKLGGQVEESCPAIAYGKAYIYCDDGYLYAVK